MERKNEKEKKEVETLHLRFIPSNSQSIFHQNLVIRTIIITLSATASEHEQK